MIANTIAGTLKIGSEVLVNEGSLQWQAGIGCPTDRRKPRVPSAFGQIGARGRRAPLAAHSERIPVTCAPQAPRLRCEGLVNRVGQATAQLNG